MDKIAVQSHWTEGRCPSCAAVCYVDEKEKRSYHKWPECEFWAKACANLPPPVEVDLDEDKL
jgi:hypothetical protein